MRFNYLAISIVFCLMALTINAQNESSETAAYQKLNNEESRLIEFKDNEELLNIKIKQLAVINASRKKHKAQPLKLDILASRVANQMAADAAKNNYSGHFNLKGESPYHRYAFGGGNDHVVENAASTSKSVQFDPTPDNILAGMTELHQAFMSEKAPNDGHKQTCIGKTFTHVGIGVAWSGTEFRYYEEYIDRYLQFGTFNTQVKAGNSVTIAVKPIDAAYHMYSVIVYHEESPKKMTAKQVSAIPSYADYSNHVVLNLPPWELPAADSKGFFNLSIATSKKGLYYVQFFLDTKPYKSGKATTQGKIIGSGVVLEAK
jgi:uncharacterized protein YkwD